ncbi:MAG: hypothetical protein GAK45_01730 [Pseudomonas citronellolis]|nr:MAG: hypothetical protein GAK45_01730 [Pseudomonas citronellolis]
MQRILEPPLGRDAAVAQFQLRFRLSGVVGGEVDARRIVRCDRKMIGADRAAVADTDGGSATVVGGGLVDGDVVQLQRAVIGQNRLSGADRFNPRALQVSAGADRLQAVRLIARSVDRAALDPDHRAVLGLDRVGLGTGSDEVRLIHSQLAPLAGNGDRGAVIRRGKCQPGGGDLQQAATVLDLERRVEIALGGIAVGRFQMLAAAGLPRTGGERGRGDGGGGQQQCGAEHKVGKAVELPREGGELGEHATLLAQHLATPAGGSVGESPECSPDWTTIDQGIPPSQAGRWPGRRRGGAGRQDRRPVTVHISSSFSTCDRKFPAWGHRRFYQAGALLPCATASPGGKAPCG